MCYCYKPLGKNLIHRFNTQKHRSSYPHTCTYIDHVGYFSLPRDKILQQIAICPRMEGVLLAPVFLSFEKFRWQKSIRNVALHTVAHVSRYHPNLYSIF